MYFAWRWWQLPCNHNFVYHVVHAASFRRDSWKFFGGVLTFFFPSISLSQGLAAGIWLRSLVYGECVFMVLSEEVANVLYFTQRRFRGVCINWRHQKESCCGGFGFFFFSKQSHTNTGLDLSSGEECCYASLNKLVFKQSFLWFTADGGMWLMLPFKTLVL